MKTWDRRAITMGLGDGLCCALLAFVSEFPPLFRLYDAAVPIDVLTLRLHHFIHFAAMLLGFLILPFRVSAIARQRYFLWGILPIFITFLGFLAAIFQNAQVFHRSLAEFPVLAVFWFVSSGPVSLWRWQSERKREREEREGREWEKTGRQEGVWPPPPKV